MLIYHLPFEPKPCVKLFFNCVHTVHIGQCYHENRSAILKDEF